MIAHINLTYFEASVEELRRKQFFGMPMAIVSTGLRVVAVNKKAEELGVVVGSTINTAIKHNAVIVREDPSYYQKKKEEIKQFLSNYKPVETDAGFYVVLSKEEAHTLRHELKRRFNVDAHIGFGKNKFEAFVASCSSEPISEIEHPSQLESFSVDMLPLPKQEIQTLKKEGITTVGRFLRKRGAKELSFFDIYEAMDGKVVYFSATSHYPDIEKQIDFLLSKLPEEKPYRATLLSVFFADGTVVNEYKEHPPLLRAIERRQLTKQLLSKLLLKKKDKVMGIGLFMGEVESIKQSFLDRFL